MELTKYLKRCIKMPFHIKRPSTLKAGTTVYYTGGSSWSESFADRKQYDTNPTAVIANTDGKNGGFANATIVSE
tara:strand:+ start:881 stop:1102 length:222 start_codon:yes stop_codon:yes gene_type:complete